MTPDPVLKTTTSVSKHPPKIHFPGADHLEFSYPYTFIGGVDEVGRGCLFGPVVAAAVILPKSALLDLAQAGVTDSKQLSANRRKKLSQQIQQVALDWRIGYATVAEIDRLNILQASLLAMRRAVGKLKRVPEFCLVDGKFTIPELGIPQETLVQGDRRSMTIASASILAKVWRDELIQRWAPKYPEYKLETNKGYGTLHHRLALAQFGPSAQHRSSFGPCQGSLPLNLP